MSKTVTRTRLGGLTIVVRLLGTALLTGALISAHPRPGEGWVWIALGSAYALWLAYLLLDGRDSRIGSGALAGFGLLASAVIGPPNGAAMAMAFVALMVFASRTAASVGAILTLTCAMVSVATASQVLWLAGTLEMLSTAAGLTMGMLIALTGRNTRLAGEQTQQLLVQTRLATEAKATTAALAERARIAREIHDIQAHSLSALSLQLQAATGFLQDQSLPADHPALAKAVGCVDRAAQLARDGLTETRRAVHALREDAGGLPEQLRILVAAHTPEPTVTITGDQRQLSAEAGLTLYRAVQEGLTNVRKHAPGTPAAITLDYGSHAVAVTVTNPYDPAAGPSSAVPSGYGITGLTERAALADGTVEAGPTGDPERLSWRLSVTLPLRSPSTSPSPAVRETT